MEAIKFIYTVLDPLLYKWWKICVIDYSQDYSEELSPEENIKYWNYIKNYIVNYELDFHISKRLKDNVDLWWNKEKTETSIKYQNKIRKKIDK